MKKLTTTQKVITLAVIVTAISFLLFGCGESATSEIKTDSVLVDSVKVDTLK